MSGTPMASTYRQRYHGTKQECRQKPLKGNLYFVMVALDYGGRGTPGGLGCVVDAKRLKQLAKAGPHRKRIRKIVSLYDTDSTNRFPSREGVLDAIEEVGSRAKAGDWFIFAYSGHGDDTKDLSGDEESGRDQILCLRTREGEGEELIDDDLADTISGVLAPGVNVLMLCDACHSGTILDTQSRGVWGSRAVVCISGCQDRQCSKDTGDGGAMTLALLEAMSRVPKKKRGNVSIQYVFNRMSDVMDEAEEGEDDEDEDEDDDNDDDDDDDDGDNDDDDNDDDDDDDNDDDDEYDEDDEDDNDDEDDEDYDQEPEPGQTINLSWTGGCDPSRLPFPF